MHDRLSLRPIACPRATARASRARLGAGLAAVSLTAGCAAVRLDAPRYVEPPASVATAKVRQDPRLTRLFAMGTMPWP